MIIKCKKRAEGYKPIKGNEKEIINHLLEHDYYDEWYVEKDVEIVSFYIHKELFCTNKESTFFKCEKDGRIHIVKEDYGFKNYVAVPFDQNNEDLMGIFTAPNFVSFERKHIVAPSLKKWGLKTTTKSFTVEYGDILIFDKNWEIVDCLMNANKKIPLNILTSHDYVVY